MCVFVRMCEHACVRACACVCAVRIFECVHGCPRVSVSVCECACKSECVRVCDFLVMNSTDHAEFAQSQDRVTTAVD